MSRIIMNLRLESRNGSLCCGRPKIGVRAYLPNPSQIKDRQCAGPSFRAAVKGDDFIVVPRSAPPAVKWDDTTLSLNC